MISARRNGEDKKFIIIYWPLAEIFFFMLCITKSTHYEKSDTCSPVNPLILHLSVFY